MPDSLTRLRVRLGDWYRWHVTWRTIPRAWLVREIALHDWGGCQLFIHDINNDGKPEFLWLQSTGIFKSRLYSQDNSVNSKLLSAHGQGLFCLTATDQSGTILWQVGQPYVGSDPYLSHAPEKMVCCYDVDGDGRTEVLALNGEDALLILDGCTGSIKNSAHLPADNFAVVACGKSGPGSGDVVVLVGVMADAYPPHNYANPWLFLDSTLHVIHHGEYLGAGHHVAIFDANGDGCDEFLIGYQLVDSHGKVVWTVDQWKGKPINPIEQHVDHVEICWIGDRWFAALAGSDKQYWIDSTGRTLWAHKLPHPQFCVVGHSESGLRIFVINQRESMHCFDMSGNEVWRGLLPENWPMGRPSGTFEPRPIHCGVPASILRTGDRILGDLIVYKEGGWPYAVNFYGQPILTFPFTERARKPNFHWPFGRINDVGLAFEAETCDLDGDSRDEIVIYDRQYAWLYRLNERYDDFL